MNFKQLGDYAKVQGGYAYKSKDFSDTGIPVLKIKNVGKGNLIYSEVSYVNESFIDTTSSFVTKEGDVLISMTGSNINQPDSMVGRVARVSKDDPISLINQRVGRIIITDEEAVDLRFLYYILSQYEVQYYLVSNATGSANQVNINGKLIESIKVPDYNLNTQKKIAHILSTLDDKIELNRKMNQTLEEMAQALFKSWFVDFDPVHLKAGCKSDAELERGARELGISKEVVELFPSEFEESELGMIPKGWSYDSLANYISVTKGKSYKSAELGESTTALVTLKSFLRGGGYRTDGIKPYTGKYKDEQVVQPGELIMAYTDVTQAADIIGKPAIVIKDESIDTLVASLDVGIVRVKSQAVNIMFLYHLFKTKRFQGYILGYTSGTTVLHLAKGWFDSYKILLPKQEIMDTFNKLVKPLFKQLQLNIEEESSLQKTRDTLLPKLLSGEIEV